MDSRAKDILKIADRKFDQKKSFDSLCQEIALNFAPERANFTDDRSSGEEFNDHSFTSYPALACRELSGVLSSFLYAPTEKKFSIHVDDEDLDKSPLERSYLEHVTDVQRRAMYDSDARLARCCKQSAVDFAAFGNSVIKFGLNSNGDKLLFNSFHLRDNAWIENADHKIDGNFRKWKPAARQLMEMFPTTVSNEVKKAFEKEPDKEFECMHIVLPSRVYDFKSRFGRRFPYVSLYVETKTETVLEETGLNYFCYVIPRWGTLPNCPFGYSLATSVMLPDGRTMQAVVRTIREAGEKYVDPPMVAVSDAIRSDIALYAGGVTTADIEYDSKVGDVLRPITQDKGSYPVGFTIAEMLKADIHQGFFLDKIQLPDVRSETTAFEIRSRIEEQIRGQAPIFDPIEEEYAELYKGVFYVLKENGTFPAEEVPDTLDGHDIKFSFRSPLAELSDERDTQIFLDGIQRVLMPVAQFDPAQLENVNFVESTRDALRAVGFKAKWFNPPEMVLQKKQELQQQMVMEKGIAALGGMSEVMQKGGKGAESIAKADANKPQE